MKTETILFDSPPPFPGPVEPAALLSEIEAVIKRHVVLNDHAAAALAVWVLHTYTFELRDAVAYVAIESPEKRCGKTTLISVLAAMAHKSLTASNITVSALFRAIDACRPTLFIDEADTFLSGNGTMRGIINSGNTWRTAYVVRLARAHRKAARTSEQTGPEAAEAGLKRFSCWCPKVIALIGQTPDTIADRSIVVKMTRKLVTETCAPLAELDATETRAKCARFALDAGKSIAQLEPIHGEGLNDRAADTFDPLYAIARHAGADWETRLHQAALGLTSSAQSESTGTELLLDILSAFAGAHREKMFSRDLAARLREGGGGGRFLKESAVSERAIARTLRSYGIKPVSMRIGKEVNKGYAAVDFHEALRRYVPKSDIEAVVEDLRRQADLLQEAKAEAKSENEAGCLQALASR